eukprot:7042321-Prymnesium_polylepis.1
MKALVHCRKHRGNPVEVGLLSHAVVGDLVVPATCKRPLQRPAACRPQDEEAVGHISRLVDRESSFHHAMLLRAYVLDNLCQLRLVELAVQHGVVSLRQLQVDRPCSVTMVDEVDVCVRLVGDSKIRVGQVASHHGELEVHINDRLHEEERQDNFHQVRAPRIIAFEEPSEHLRPARCVVQPDTVDEHEPALGPHVVGRWRIHRTRPVVVESRGHHACTCTAGAPHRQPVGGVANLTSILLHERFVDPCGGSVRPRCQRPVLPWSPEAASYLARKAANDARGCRGHGRRGK